jgi:glycosyltransferase involved in cell wall biosynthesis
MNVIALLPVKNEAWILRTTLPQLKRFADHIVVLDGNSTDDTCALVKSYGGSVLRQATNTVNYSEWRQTLLNKGRELGGTHFVCLDADEAFSSNLIPSFRERLARMKPGQSLVFDWLCLWKDPHQIRNDRSIWSINLKDIVFCDDARANFPPGELLHEKRTPGTKDQMIRVPRDEGSVLHFQFVPFQRFQMKQAYQRCREWVMKTASAVNINRKYAMTLDKPYVPCISIPLAWLEGLPHLDALKDQDFGWYYSGIWEYFTT